jgi:hypothetical protein
METVSETMFYEQHHVFYFLHLPIKNSFFRFEKICFVGKSLASESLNAISPNKLSQKNDYISDDPLKTIISVLKI